MPHVPPAGPADMAVRPRPDTPPVTAAPVEHVVRAPGRSLVPACRPVGDLVPAVAGRGKRLVSDEVTLGEHIVVRRGQLAAPHARCQSRARLHGERVRRHMVGSGSDGGRQRAPPVGVGLPRRAVDQVQADVLEPGRAGPRGAAGRTPRLVHAIEHRQHARHRALHPERNPGYALGPQFAEAGLVNAFRVGLRRHLGAGGQAELGVDGPQDVAEGGRGHQGRRPAAKEHRAHRDVRTVFISGEHLAGERDLGEREAGVAAHGYRGAAGRPAEFGGSVGVEVAVAAAGRAERHVYVDPERPLTQPADRALRQDPVDGDGLAVGQGTGHAATLPAREGTGAGPPPVRGGSQGSSQGEHVARLGICALRLEGSRAW